ncbi:MAG: hypothetical protein COA69_12740 [Robiginitomaculum sp.]|nr:MAG: hypothetical protein COA69_12740 [Robiginitomaculum sp.]
MAKFSLFSIAGVIYLMAMTSTAFAQTNGKLSQKITIKNPKTPTDTLAAIKTSVPPRMPYAVYRSGFCCMLVDVDKTGVPTLVKTSFCSENMFKRTSIRSVKKWRFEPANIKGTPVSTTRQPFLVTYRFFNSRGRLVPDENRLLVSNGKLDYSLEKLCQPAPVN